MPRPPKLIAAFGNYREGSDRERQTQDMFLESPDSVIGPGGTVVLPNHPATIFHHEAELALVVGQRAKDLPADERALEALAGYTCAIDVSARGHGAHRSQPHREVVRHLYAARSGDRDRPTRSPIRRTCVSPYRSTANRDRTTRRATWSTASSRSWPSSAPT